MERKEKKLTAFNESVCILNFKSSETFLKKKKSIPIIENEQCSGSCKPVERIKSFSSRNGCSKSCTHYRENKDRAQTSDGKPQILRESSSRQTKSDTKSAGELSDQVKTTIKETSEKLQSVLPFLGRTTKHTLAKMKSLYKSLKTRRVLGFKCDLKKCDSTLMECSTRACKKDSMVFGESSHSYDLKMTDPSISDTSTISSSSEKAREF
ncbi:hypothetical protein ACS0PU_008503 [Formica fusca]